MGLGSGGAKDLLTFILHSHVVWYGVAWWYVCGVACGVVWCGMVWYGVVWCGLVWLGVVWKFGVVWKIAVCQNRALTRAPELPYGAKCTELRCTCGGMGVG